MLELLFNLAVLVVAFAVVVTASHVLINSAIDISRLFGIGKFAIGFVLVSVATSLPEFAIAVNAGLLGQGGIVIGNVIGANITDILFVLGLSALVAPLIVKEDELINSAEILLLTTLIPIILLMRGSIQFVGGLILLSIFGFYVFFISKQHISLDIGKDHISKAERLNAVLMFAIALAVLLASASFVVSSAVNIANLISILPSVIALTIISIGSTLPELMVNITAMKRGETTLALGNILGSCVTNLTLVLGCGALLTKIPIEYAVFGPGIFFLIAAIAFLNYVLIRYKKITREFALIFVMAYIIFLVSEFGIISIL